MKSTLFVILPIFISLIIWPVNIYAQDIPELDVATSFGIYKNGQNLLVEYHQFVQLVGVPNNQLIDNEGVDLTYGLTTFSFIFGYPPLENAKMYEAHINDTQFYININGIDLRVGDLADELAEHFQKSWAARNFNWPSRTSFPNHLILVVRISEVESISVFINSSGLISKIRYSMRLT